MVTDETTGVPARPERVWTSADGRAWWSLWLPRSEWVSATLEQEYSAPDRYGNFRHVAHVLGWEQLRALEVVCARIRAHLVASGVADPEGVEGVDAGRPRSHPEEVLQLQRESARGHAARAAIAEDLAALEAAHEGRLPAVVS